MRWSLPSLLLSVLLILPAAARGRLEGVASVMDGDTIEIHGARIRLNGIDAPESDQLCQGPDGSKWHYGQKSAFALADFISRAVIRCEPRDRDRYGRIVAVCFKGDISERLAARSWLGSRLPRVFSRLCSR